MTLQHLSREQARAFDKHATEVLGIPSVVLMENAGRGAAEILTGLGIQRQVVVCCGKGNNGGDGLVIARHLANAGFDVLPLLFAPPDALSVEAALQWNIVQKMRLPTQVWADKHLEDAKLAALFAEADWIVDALFGTGLTGPVRSPLDRVIELVNASGKRVLAVDIPSGLDADTGEPFGPTIRAEHTVTFVAPKLGFHNPASLAWTGQVQVVDIGIVKPARSASEG